MFKRKSVKSAGRFRAFAALAVVGTLAAPCGAAEVTKTFRQGLDGYAGVVDTWVSRLDWDTPPQRTVNYGLNTDLTLSRDAGDNPLLRFDLSSVPANSAVVSATLSLYNTQQSSYSGTRDFARRVRLYRVLKAWDEGNQVNSPVDASGKHGATGEYAADWFTGEGTDIPWAAVGMAEGTDYAATWESFADVVNAGWYAWDVTELVRRWVRGEAPNLGLVLRDATGYADDHVDWRTFRSSQFTGDLALRPTLVVVYNPDVPFADAGADVTNLQWNGNAVLLDASGSHDRPGGDDQTLVYRWQIIRAAYGSALSGTVYTGSQNTIGFTPDAAGVWSFQLTVTNSLGETATDTVTYRLLQIPGAHPRIFLTASKLAALQSRAVTGNPRWDALVDEADEADGAMLAKALVFAVTGLPSYGDQAVAAAQASLDNPASWSMKHGEIALVYDWCHPRLSAGQKTQWVDRLNTWAETQQATGAGNDIPGWGNYWPRFTWDFALIGLATYGENPRAGEWLTEFRTHRFENVDLPLLDIIAHGGAWPEGTVYDWIARRPHCQAVEAWRSATGENLFLATDWFRNRLGWLLMQSRPGTIEQWGNFARDYPSIGDAERNRVSMANYGRTMGLLLIERFPGEADARQLQAVLASPPADRPMSFVAHEEFLWFNPAQAAEPPSRRTLLAGGTGTLVCRSDWPSGAADTDTSATHVQFQCGDHFTYHQHYDQNSFTLFKHADLALDSGVYSGDGLSYHDQNYYVRTLAHNTLCVYNPTERFDDARPDAESNDGGQRTMLPASRYPTSAEYFATHAVHYDTGDLLRFQDDARYTYALGDATKAYNNPTYYQALDTPYTTNTPKLSRFHREFLYVRPPAGFGLTRDYLVLFDRVGVTQSAFSGSNTKLLFHVLNEPAVDGTPSAVSPGETLYTGGSSAVATNGSGKLFLRTLLPAQRNIRTVGGRGVKAFWVFGANYDWHWSAAEPQPRPVNDFEDTPYGEWRLEVEPADTGLHHNFLTVLHPAESTAAAMPAATLVSAQGLAGVHLADPAENVVALFSSAVDGSAPSGSQDFTLALTTQTARLLVFDLTPGAGYTVNVGANGTQTVVGLVPGGATPVSAQGVLDVQIDLRSQPGDLNLDGLVNAVDLVLLRGLLSGDVIAGRVPGYANADLSGDGRVDAVDLALLMREV